MEEKIKLAYLCNKKEISTDYFKERTGEEFFEFWEKNKREIKKYILAVKNNKKIPKKIFIPQLEAGTRVMVNLPVIATIIKVEKKGYKLRTEEIKANEWSYFDDSEITEVVK